MIINHNLMAMNTKRQMGINQGNSAKSIEKLSSGMRINKAGDDAAGLAISEKMRGQIRGLDQASRNSQDAISMIQTGEGALQETQAILQRMRELAVQSANGTNTDSDRGQIQNEITQLSDEINRIGNTTEFNTQKLINGTKDKTEELAAVKNASSIDKIGTGDDKFTVRATATGASATGAVINGSTTIHQGTEGSYKMMAVDVGDGTGTALATAGIDGAHNELTVKIGDVVRSFSFDDTAATDGAIVTDMKAKLIAAFKAAPSGGVETGAAMAAGVADNLSVAIEGGRIVIKDAVDNKGAGSTVEVIGGNAASIITGSTDVKADGAAANNELTVKYNDGTADRTVTMTLADGTYNTPADLATQIEAKFNAAAAGAGAAATDLDFSADAGVAAAIKIASDATHVGSDAKITSIEGSAAAFTGLTGAGASFVDGQNANNKFNITVDGNTYNNVEIAAADTDFTSADSLAAAMQTAINNAITGADPDREQVTVTALDVADTDRVRFQVTSGKTGGDSNITFGAVADNDGMASLGFNATTETGQAGADASISYHIGANKGQALSLAIADMRSTALGITGSAAGDDTVTEVDGATVADVTYSSNSITNGSETEFVIDVTTAANADKAVEVINNAIEKVSQERAKLGATQNRLEHTIKNLETSSENLTAAESRIRDVDMAKEMMAFQKNNILSQAAQSMLAQANQQPQGVLQLLR